MSSPYKETAYTVGMHLNRNLILIAPLVLLASAVLSAGCLSGSTVSWPATAVAPPVSADWLPGADGVAVSPPP